MKKIGFTLAELLVTIAIVGIVASITLASMHRIMPDKDKGMVLKAYKTLMDINKDILEDPSLYVIGGRINGTPTICNRVLACTERPLDPDTKYTGCEGANKYIRLVMDRMVIAQSISNTNPARFITSDGMEYRLQGTSTNTNDIHYTLTLDTRNPSRQNCVYNSSTCPNPRLFTFNITPDGFIEPTDNLSRAYLMNPSDLSDRDADLQRASEL